MCYFPAKFGYFFIWLAGKICFWRVADFLAILAENLADFCTLIFVQDLDPCLIH